MNKCCKKIVDATKISHDEWLDTRRTGIGGSDSSTIVGLNPYNSPYALYLDKIGDCAEKPDNEAMRQGRDFEQYVADRWMEATGKKCRRNNFMWRSTRWPYMLADIDREIVGENAGLECKTTSVFNKSDLAGGEIPQTYYVQCQHYMAVLGFERMYLAVLVLNRGFYHFVIERDEAEIEALAAAEGEFWNCIANQQPPEVDGSEATVNAIKKQYPEAAADLPMMDLGKSAADDLAALAEINADIKSLKDSGEAIKARIMAEMGECPVAAAPGWNISWKNQIRKSIDSKKLKAEYPEAYDSCLSESSSRVFRFTKAKN